MYFPKQDEQVEVYDTCGLLLVVLLFFLSALCSDFQENVRQIEMPHEKIVLCHETGIKINQLIEIGFKISSLCGFLDMLCRLIIRLNNTDQPAV